MNQDASLEYVDCPVCGPSRMQVWLEDGKPTRYVRCLECGTVYASPRAPWSSRYAWLDDTFSVTDGVFDLMDPRLPALQLEASFVQKHIPGGKMLDVGCSIGSFFEFFPPSSWDRYGVELIPSAAKYAAEKYHCQVKVGTLQEAAYEQDYFDFISLIDTLYYLDDPAGEFREMHRILKPGGFVAVEVAGQAYMLKRNYGLIPWLIDRRWSRAGTDSSYIYWFGPRGLGRLFKKTGYEVVAWYVVPSPKRYNRIINSVIQVYFMMMKTLSGFSNRWLSWSPKYLCIAQKEL